MTQADRLWDISGFLLCGEGTDSCICLIATETVVSPSNGRRPVEHFIHCYSQRIHIGFLIRFPAAGLLRCNIMHRPPKHCRFPLSWWRSPQIWQLPKSVIFTSPSGVTRMLCGLQISMNYAVIMRGLDRFAEIERDLKCTSRTASLPLIRKISFSVGPSDILRRDIGDAVIIAYGIYLRQYYYGAHAAWPLLHDQTVKQIRYLWYVLRAAPGLSPPFALSPDRRLHR